VDSAHVRGGRAPEEERGEDSIFDFTLGNPEVEPPALTLAALRRVVDKGRPHSHGYMPNPGFPEVRAAIADKLRREVALPFTAEHVCMTTGAAAACNVILKTILDPGDEVILLAPFFAEYPFYVGITAAAWWWSRPTRNACRMSSASPRPYPAHSRHHSEHAQQSFGPRVSCDAAARSGDHARAPAQPAAGHQRRALQEPGL